MKKYYMTIGGIRKEISADRAAQIRRLQDLIRKSHVEAQSATTLRPTLTTPKDGNYR